MSDQKSAYQAMQDAEFRHRAMLRDFRKELEARFANTDVKVERTDSADWGFTASKGNTRIRVNVREDSEESGAVTKPFAFCHLVPDPKDEGNFMPDPVGPAKRMGKNEIEKELDKIFQL